MEPGPLLEQAATFTANHLDYGFSREMLQQSVNTFGTALIAELRPDDEPGVLAPVVFLIDGTPRAGVALTVTDRAVFVWQRGALRVKLGTAVVPFNTVTHVQEGTRQSNDPSKRLAELVVTAAKTWNLAAPVPTSSAKPLMSELAERFRPQASAG